ncbi:hypothetical protein SLA2020_070040 [Shorea laevis]
MPRTELKRSRHWQTRPVTPFVERPNTPPRRSWTGPFVSDRHGQTQPILDHHGKANTAAPFDSDPDRRYHGKAHHRAVRFRPPRRLHRKANPTPQRSSLSFSTQMRGYHRRRPRSQCRPRPQCHLHSNFPNLWCNFFICFWPL